MGRDSAAGMTSLSNIGDGIITEGIPLNYVIWFTGKEYRMVYVLSANGNPLMPTMRYGKVRHLLKSGLARVVKRTPFTIRLNYDTSEYTQPVSLGIDAGSKHIGISASTEDKVLYEAEVELRNDIVELLSTRREARRTRRNRKTRYRKPKFLNRVKSKNKGWLAPSIEQKISTHMTVVCKVCEMLPISRMTVETAAFDIQLLKAVEEGRPVLVGTDYQRGEQLASWNVREYVLFRDGHVCRCCKGRSKDTVLETHHLQSRKVGGDAPNNLVTLCRTCHKGYHRGTVTLPEDITRGNRYNDAAFMGIMRWTFYERLKNLYGDMVSLTYGYITKNTRIENGLPKTHYIDARCIGGNPKAESDGNFYKIRKVRCHNRQIHKFGILKGGIRKRNQAEYLVKGYRLFDKVKYLDREYFVFGRRSSGYFDIRTLDGEKVNKGSISCKKIRLAEPAGHYLTERRLALLS